MQTKMLAYNHVVTELNVALARLRGSPRDILSYCRLPFFCWSLKLEASHASLLMYVVPSFTLHLLNFHSVTRNSNNSKLPYTRKNRQRTTCPPNTQVLTSSNHNVPLFEPYQPWIYSSLLRFSWICCTHCSLSNSPPALVLKLQA